MNLFSRLFPKRKADLDEEIQAHLRMAARDRRDNGESQEQARAAATREFGNVALVKDVTRETWGWLQLEHFFQDLRYAFRQIRRSPGFAAGVIGTLALGIGAAAAMFTLVDHLLLRPLPYRDAERLVTIRATDRAGDEDSAIPWLDIEQWIAQNHSFEQIAFYEGMGGRNYLEGKTASRRITATLISPNLFEMLGAKASLGRGFVPERPSFAAAKNLDTIVLSDLIWKEAYGSDPRIVGKVVKINADLYTVTGVMPPGFRYPFGGASAPQVWVPIQLGEKDRDRSDTAMNYEVIARLRRGTTIKGAAAEMAIIQKRIAGQYTDPDLRDGHTTLALLPYSDSLVEADLKKALLVLLAASGMLWLISSLNVTSLLLARTMARRREIAMRGALGASHRRVVQQMITEGLVLSGGAALLGIGLALVAIRVSRSSVPKNLHVDLSIHVNVIIVAVLTGLTLLSAMFSSAWPAFLAVRAPIEPALKQDGQQSGMGRRQHRVRSILVAAQIAMSLILLVACGLLLRTIYTLRHVPLGYRTDHIIVADLDIPSFRFTGKNMQHDLYQPLLERVQHTHGIDHAGLMSEVPLGSSFNIMLSLYLNGNHVVAHLKAVTPDVQRVFGFHMLAGRFFNRQDTPTLQPVVVVNPAFARLYAPNKHDPAGILGVSLLNLRKDTPARIIGILNNERQISISEQSQPEVEFCLCQLTPESGFYQPTTIAMDLAARTDREPSSVIPELRSILRQASPELANTTFTTMDQLVEDSYGSQRLAAHLLEIFGGSALLLCVAGLYGLLAYVVTQRRHEIGVRIALGAQRGSLLWLVLRQAGTMMLGGVAIGVLLSLASARLIRSYLYGVSAHDGWTLAIAATLLFASGMLAAYLPARRAASVDPIEALRAE